MNSIIRDSAKLLTANVVAQAIGLLVYPILTRLYSPDDFGLLNLFLSIGGVLVLLSTAEYQYAIVLPKDDNKARAVTQVGLTVLSIVTMIILLSLPFSGSIGSLFKAPGLANWWWLMPIYVAALGGWQLVRHYLLRFKAFNNLSCYQYSQSTLNAAGKMGFGVAGFLSGGLIISSVVAPLLSLGISIGLAWRKMLRPLMLWNKNLCIEEARKYRKFPCFSLPRSLVNYVSGNLPVLMLTPVYGLTEMGFFGMALTLSFLPINMIVQSVYQVLFQRTAQLVNEKEPIKGLLYGYVWRAFVVLLPTFIGLYFILPWLTGWLLGDEWRVSGEFIRLLLPWLLMTGIVGPIGFVTDIFGKQGIALWVEVTYMLLRLASLTVGIVMHNLTLAIALYSLAGTLVLCGQFIWYATIIRRYTPA